jgi:hypothetical protein
MAERSSGFRNRSSGAVGVGLSEPLERCVVDRLDGIVPLAALTCISWEWKCLFRVSLFQVGGGDETSEIAVRCRMGGARTYYRERRESGYERDVGLAKLEPQFDPKTVT